MTVMKFGATWCAPCRMQDEILRRVEDYTKVKLIKVDVDMEPDKASEYGISSLPTTLIMEDGKTIHKFAGVVSEDKLLNILV